MPHEAVLSSQDKYRINFGTIPLVVPHFLDATKSTLYAVTPSDF